MDRAAVEEDMEDKEEENEEYSDNFDDSKSPEAGLDQENPPRPSAPV